MLRLIRTVLVCGCVAMLVGCKDTKPTQEAPPPPSGVEKGGPGKGPPQPPPPPPPPPLPGKG